MIFWGFVLLIGGGLAAVIAFLSNLDMFHTISTLGFGKWLERFVTPKYLTSGKIFFVIGIILLIVGIVLLIKGKTAAKKTGKTDNTTQKAGKFLRDLRGEFKKITWPALPDVARNTGATLVMCVIVGAVVCLIDLGLSQLVMLLLSVGG